MGACLALLGRAAVSDLCLYRDKGRMPGIFFRLLNGGANGLQVITVLHSEGLETKGSHAGGYILGKSQVCASLDGNAVGIVQNDQFMKAHGACKGKRLVGDPLHHTAVAA